MFKQDFEVNNNYRQYAVEDFCDYCHHYVSKCNYLNKKDETLMCDDCYNKLPEKEMEEINMPNYLYLREIIYLFDPELTYIVDKENNINDSISTLLKYNRFIKYMDYKVIDLKSNKHDPFILIKVEK